MLTPCIIHVSYFLEVYYVTVYTALIFNLFYDEVMKDFIHLSALLCSSDFSNWKVDLFQTTNNQIDVGYFVEDHLNAWISNIIYNQLPMDAECNLQRVWVCLNISVTRTSAKVLSFYCRVEIAVCSSYTTFLSELEI